MELRDLTAFVTAVELGGMTRAAERLHLVQSAVSQAVRRLERETGVTLLERRPGGVRPTEAGAVLARHSRSILNAVERAGDEMAAFRGLDVGTVRIGLLPTTTPLLLVPLLGRLKTAHPGLRPRVEEGMADELLDRLRLGDLDLAVILLPVDAPGLELVELARVDAVVAHGPSHRLVGRRRVRLADLAAENWVSFPPGNPGRRWLDDASTPAGFRPRVVAEVDTLAHLKACVEAGLGLAMVPAAAVELERRIGRVGTVDVVDPKPSVTVAYAVVPDHPGTALAAVRPLLEVAARL